MFLPRLLLLFVLLWVWGGEAERLKIASWNVENLFDMREQGTEYAEYRPGKHGWNERMLQKKLLNLTQVICDLDADVVALQEVENDGILARLQKTLRRVGCPYPYRAITTGAGRPVHVALLSRKKISVKREIPISRAGRERRILEAVLATTPPLRIFVNHWRSKRGPESERVRYAKALRKRLERLPAGTEYLLAGDFNSDYQEYRILKVRHNDTGGITGINHILGTIDARGRLIRRERLRSMKGLHHMNLWLDLESSRRWSHNFFGDREAIDAILIPPSLADGKGWEYRSGSFGVFRPRYLFGSHGEIRRWEFRHGKHGGRGFSDHLPIHAVFETVETSGGLSGHGKTKHRNSGEKSTSSKAVHPEPPTTIGALQKLRNLNRPLRLEGVVLVAKWGRHGVLQRKADGPAILLYGAASGLEEGHRYDLIVHGFKRYKGMPEITDLEPLLDRGEVASEKYIPRFAPEMMGDPGFLYRVVGGIEGIYRKGKIVVAGREIPIHFKKRRWKPMEGSLLRIKRAQIGYYKDHQELVVWDRSDFEKRRK